MANIIIELDDFKYQGEAPTCECSGTVVPTIYRFPYLWGQGKPELRWTCTKCHKSCQ